MSRSIGSPDSPGGTRVLKYGHLIASKVFDHFPNNEVCRGQRKKIVTVFRVQIKTGLYVPLWDVESSAHLCLVKWPPFCFVGTNRLHLWGNDKAGSQVSVQLVSDQTDAYFAHGNHLTDKIK